MIKPALVTSMVLMAATAALAHGYRAGNLEIIHPVIMAPSAHADCSCAHVKIVNHGTRPEFLLGARISAAERTHLVSMTRQGHGLSMPRRVEIGPGETLALGRQDWCLFMSGITTSLEAGMGAVAGELVFEHHGPIAIEFMIDKAQR